MSLATWLKEFRPVPPSKARSIDAMLRYALRIWTGRLKKNLEKHGCTASILFVSDKTPRHRESLDCLLCQRFGHNLGKNCVHCPLDPCYSAWSIWVVEGDARPMVRHIKWAMKKMGVKA